MPKDTLTITDNRTGHSYEFPISYGTYAGYGAAIRAEDLRQIKASEDDFGLMSYDPAGGNTAACRSAITFVDGDRGILRYRGYPIEELAEQSTYLEVAYLLLRGELPDRVQLDAWSSEITLHTMVHESIKKFLDGFRYDAHPMGVLVGTVGALSTFYPEAKNIEDPVCRATQIVRLIAKMPTLAAMAYRHQRGMPYVYPDNDLSFTGNFLNLLWRTTEPRYEPNPVLERALEVLFILHADHEQNCSANTMRCIGSSRPDPYSALSGAAAALYGPLHGGANEAVLRMLDRIGSKDRVSAFVEGVKAGEERLMGFGHRVYKNYDPRARIIKATADQVFSVTGVNPLLEIALELERVALEDEYFIERKLYPNVDFYSGIIYQAIGLPVDMFPVLFAIPRTAGWLAQWEELLQDSEQRINRPRQIYDGCDVRGYVPLSERGVHPARETRTRGGDLASPPADPESPSSPGRAYG
ncbi:MAG: citrate synthase [Deltaproteobacteria bacterium]|nr:citrate synthase [Deltaproteobacteria bacterium]